MSRREDLVNDYEDENLLFADGFDDAILGVGQQWGSDLIVVYSINKCVDILMKRDGMTYEEATEYMDYNVICAYVGEKTPFFMYGGGE